jgi:hypothetical protein
VTDHPITPSPELVASLRNSAPHGIRTRELWLINSAYAAGADQELEACCEWTAIVGGADALRAARRPKPPTLAEQGMEALRSTTFEKQCHYDAMFAALKRLAELEPNQ